MIELLQAYWDNSIKPQLAATATNCSAAKTVIPQALSWARQIGLFFSEDLFSAERDAVIEAFIAAEVNCFNEADKKCKNNSDPTEAVNMLSAARTLVIFGADQRLGPDWFDKVDKCANMTFKLDISTTYRLDKFTSDLTDIQMQLHAGTTLRWNSGEKVFRADKATAFLRIGWHLRRPAAAPNFPLQRRLS